MICIGCYLALSISTIANAELTLKCVALTDEIGPNVPVLFRVQVTTDHAFTLAGVYDLDGFISVKVDGRAVKSSLDRMPDHQFRRPEAVALPKQRGIDFPVGGRRTMLFAIEPGFSVGKHVLTLTGTGRDFELGAIAIETSVPFVVRQMTLSSSLDALRDALTIVGASGRWTLLSSTFAMSSEQTGYFWPKSVNDFVWRDEYTEAIRRYAMFKRKPWTSEQIRLIRLAINAWESTAEKSGDPALRDDCKVQIRSLRDYLLNK